MEGHLKLHVVYSPFKFILTKKTKFAYFHTLLETGGGGGVFFNVLHCLISLNLQRMQTFLLDMQLGKF